MRFSIITVCLDAGQDLLDTVNSTLSQTYQAYELIVKDGGSNDGSTEALPKDSRIRLVQQKDGGIYDAMNQGVQAAIGDYLIFMNCGDLFYDRDVLHRIDQAITQQQVLCYYGLCYNRKLDSVNAYPRELTRFTCFRTMICHQSTVYSRELFAEKMYDVSYRILADREYLMWMVCQKRIAPQYLDFIIVNYQADGACEDAKFKEQNQKDIARMNGRYLTKWERVRFQLMHSLTLPRLRAWFSRDPRLGKFYMKMVDMLYRVIKR